MPSKKQFTDAMGDSLEASADALLTTAAAAFLISRGVKPGPEQARWLAIRAIDTVIKRTEAEGAKPRLQPVPSPGPDADG